MSDHPHQFLTLDFMRGVAALVVVEFHTASYFGYRSARHGYLAVDFFFLLSGFVLSLAYQDKLDAGWPNIAFYKVRLIRLYPLYLLGAVLGLIAALLEIVHPALRANALFFAFALCLIPTPTAFPAALGAAYPLNFPSWSLFLELVTNLFHAHLLRRKGWAFLASTAILSGILLVGSVKFEGTVDFGIATKSIFIAIPRALFSYIMGMALFRLWRSGRIRVRLPFLLPPVLLIAILILPESAHLATRFDLFAIVCAFPLILLVSLKTIPPPRLVVAAGLLGRLSYALYVLHMPILKLQLYVWEHGLRRNLILDRPWSGIFYIITIIIVSLLADRLYDLPFRTLLRKRLSSTTHQGARRGDRLTHDID